MSEMKDSKEMGLSLSPENHSGVGSEDVLRVLGFEVDSNVLSDGGPGLSFDFGNFKLEASHSVNRWFRRVMTLGGVA